MAKERHREKERKRDRKSERLSHLSIHQWVLSAIFASHQLTSPISFLFLKLPPPPCAVLLVFWISWIFARKPLHELSLFLIQPMSLFELPFGRRQSQKTGTENISASS
jgi:hypothetical protein